MEQEAGPSSIFQVWEALHDPRTSVLHEALLREISRHLDIEDRFSDFAMRLVNADLPGNPVGTRFVHLDPSFPDGEQPTWSTHELGRSDARIDLSDVPGLAYRFHHVAVPGPSDGTIAVQITADEELRAQGVPVVEALVRDERGMYTRRQVDLGPDGSEYCVGQMMALVASNGSTDTDAALAGGLTLERTQSPACALAGDVVLELTGEYHSGADTMPYTEHSAVHWRGALDLELGGQETTPDGTVHHPSTGTTWAMRGVFRHERCDAFAPERCPGYVVEQQLEGDGEITRGTAGTAVAEDGGWSVEERGWLRAEVEDTGMRLEANLPVTVTTTQHHPLRPTETRTEEVYWRLSCVSGGTWWLELPGHDEYAWPGGGPLTARWTDDARTSAELECRESWEVEIGGGDDESGSGTFTAHGTIQID
jgi:hypothetical protein